MGVLYNSRIVTDGLVLCVDAGDKMSYPGAGTTWTDLSKQGNNGTLTNGPTFDSANGGSIVFDGTDDRISMNSINIGSIFTAFMWVKFKSNSYNTVLAGHVSNSDGGYIFYVQNSNTIYASTNGGYGNISNAGLVTDQWVLLTNVRTGTSASLYKNSIVLGSFTMGSDDNTLSSIGSYSGGGYRLDGQIALTQIYNRALSAQEIRQNYKATKARFGL